jgi:hypothetical protein
VAFVAILPTISIDLTLFCGSVSPVKLDVLEPSKAKSSDL